MEFANKLLTILDQYTVKDATLAMFTLYLAHFSAQFLLQKIQQLQKQANYKKIIQNFLQSREQSFNSLQIPDPGFSETFTQQILNAKVHDLKVLLKEEKITSEKLLNLYARRAYSFGKKYNWITVQNYQNALEDARRCDQMRKDNPQQCNGELFGIVISIKDSFDLKDTPTTIGCASRLDYIPKTDGLIIKILKQSGAIVFVKTNMPQAALMIETVNNIYGRGQNPWNTKRCIGGSSGGEGALIAAKCTPLGLGSDIGGSIRNPAAMNGITSLKPTAERVVLKGLTFFSPSMDGQESIKIANGPMSKYVDDSAIMMQALLNNNHLQSIPLPEHQIYHTNRSWDNSQYQTQKKLKIAYFKSLDVFQPPLCIQRAVQEAADSLKENGHTVVEIKFPFEKRCIELFTKIIASDKYQGMHQLIKQEKTTDFTSKLNLMVQLTNFVFNPIIEVILRLLCQKRLANTFKLAKRQDAFQYRNTSYEVQLVRQNFVEYMSQNNFDAIICPTHGVPAGTHDYSCDLLDALNYESMFNVLNVPCGVIPISVVQDSEQNYNINDGHYDLQKKVAQREMKNSKGLPLTAQIVGLPMQEELVLNIMKQIEKNIKFHEKHPYPSF